MTCRNRGKEIEKTETVCQNCGSIVDNSAIGEEKTDDQKAIRQRKVTLSWLTWICVIIGGACLVILLLIVMGLKNGSAEFTEKLQTLQDSSDELTGRVTALEDDIRSQITEQAKKENELKVTQQPTDSEIVMDERQNVWIFTAAAIGSNPTFNWQKFNENTNSWENIDISLGAACGFTTEESNIVNGRQSKLLANIVDYEYFGQYRCEITDSYGQSLISAAAQLSERLPEQTESKQE